MQVYKLIYYRVNTLPKDYGAGAYYAGADPNSLQGQVMRTNMDDSSFKSEQSSVHRTLTSPYMAYMDDPELIHNEYGCLVSNFKGFMY